MHTVVFPIEIRCQHVLSRDFSRSVVVVEEVTPVELEFAPLVVHLAHGLIFRLHYFSSSEIKLPAGPVGERKVF